MCVVPGKGDQSKAPNYPPVNSSAQYDYIDTEELLEEQDNALKEIMDKLDKNTNGKFHEVMLCGDYKRAEEYAKMQSKIKKITKEELDIVLSEISQYY